MRREYQERFPRYRLQRKPLLISDPIMHHGTCVTHVPWCMSGSLSHGGGENVLGIPSTCATRNFNNLTRGPWSSYIKKFVVFTSNIFLYNLHHQVRILTFDSVTRLPFSSSIAMPLNSSLEIHKWHNEAGTKWLSFYRQHFQMPFLHKQVSILTEISLSLFLSPTYNKPSFLWTLLQGKCKLWKIDS